MVKTDKQHDCTLIAKDLFGNLVLASDTMPGAKQRKKSMDLEVRQVLLLHGYKTLGKSLSCFLRAILLFEK